MATPTPSRIWLERALQRYLLAGIASAYVLAAFWPAGGIWLRAFSLWDSGATPGVGSATPVNLLLALLLFNTGLSVPLSELIRLGKNYRLVTLGMSIRLTTGALAILSALSLSLFFQGRLANELLLGLILITIMPVANSSAGWSHHSEANVGLSMWLILLSVLLSPWLVPGLLVLAGEAAAVPFAANYHVLAKGYAGPFVLMWVVIPALFGMTCRGLVLKNGSAVCKLRMKTVTFLCLVLLNYANGSVSLPEVLRGGQSGLVFVSLMGAILLCSLLFLAAWAVGHICRLSMPERLSVMYSTAMSNTGVALVLSTTLLPTAETLHLVVIFYTLLQHIGAGIVDQWDYCARRVGELDLSDSNSSIITSQPVLNASPSRPTTQTGSQAAMTEPVASISNGS